MDDPSTVRLGATGWRIWRDSTLRSAGFGATEVLRLADPELARSADTDDRRFRTVQAEAIERLRAELRRFASDERVREAIAWQNPPVLSNCLDRLIGDHRRRGAADRKRELSLVSYLQRYCTKNDTIGFFGPVGWARWVDTGPTTVRPGHRLLAERTTYFEMWAIDAFAASFARHPAVGALLRPCRRAEHLFADRTLRLADHRIADLSPIEIDVLELADGDRTAAELVEHLSAVDSVEGLWPVLSGMVERGLLHMDLLGPIEATPERTLRDRIAELPEPAVRDRLLHHLDEVTGARDAVAAAAGHADAVAARLTDLDQVFGRLTGADPQRRPGRTYAGRRLVYEDAVRDVRVRLGPDLLDALADPLGIVLDSARWLVRRAADEYRRLFDELFDRYTTRTGASSMPLAVFVQQTTPYLAAGSAGLRPPVTEVVGELQRHWTELLCIPADVRRWRVEPSAIAAAARERFEVVGHRPPWSNAIHHSPDLMLDVDRPEALADARNVRFVLGELHVANNTMESRCFVEQHPAPWTLVAADEADHGSRRVCLLASRDWGFVTSRTAPPSALLSPHYTSWALRSDSDHARGGAVPAAAASVRRSAGGLVVADARDGREYDLLEMLGDLLSAAVANAFRPLPPRPHLPRVCLGPLVVHRESWTFPVSTLAWTRTKDEAERFRSGRAWRAEHHLPERVFYRLPAETKPMYLDFGSIPLLNLFVRGVRKTARATPTGEVSLSEMLPDVTRTWLRDADGAGYTAELRLIATDRP